MEGGVGLSRCPGEGQIYAAKTRREMEDREALPRLPPCNPGCANIFMNTIGFSLRLQGVKYRAGHGETSACFGGVNLDLPRTTRGAYASLH